MSRSWVQSRLGPPVMVLKIIEEKVLPFQQYQHVVRRSGFFGFLVPMQRKCSSTEILSFQRNLEMLKIDVYNSPISCLFDM